MMPIDEVLLTWMLDSDPALCWQVERDLAHAPSAVWQATRARVPDEGFGAALLAKQDPDGQWAGGAFFPAGFDFDGPEAQPGAGQPWTATTWSLKSLREWGVEPERLEGTVEKLRANCTWEYDDLPFWDGEVDACINAWTLAAGAWLGADVTGIAQWFVDHRMDEGGWNCEWVEGSTRASFTSTLNAIEGILFYEQATGGTPELRAARRAGEEYLLRRRLLYRETTGELFAPWAVRFAYPFRSFYSALHAVDYFRTASLHDGAAPDERIADAVEVIRAARRADGTWEQERRHPGRVWFEIDVPAGEPSKWLTFHALRALEWWDRGSPSDRRFLAPT